MVVKMQDNLRKSPCSIQPIEIPVVVVDDVQHVYIEQVNGQRFDAPTIETIKRNIQFLDSSVQEHILELLGIK
jgi:hypothetical protein